MRFVIILIKLLCMYVCYIIALTWFSKLSKTWRLENPCFGLPRCRLTAPLQETLANIRETGVFFAISLSPSAQIFIQIFVVSSERRMCFKTECVMTLQGHPSSLILVPIESAYRTSYWFSIVTLVLSCRVSEILELLYAKSHFSVPHPYSGQNF